MFERFHADARQTVVLAQEEARLLGHDAVGTEHLLLALLRQPDTVAAQILARHGLEHDNVGDTIARFLAAAPPSEEIDASALESIGIDLDAIREKVEAAFGPGALDREPRGRRNRFWRPGNHIPFTAGSKKVLELSLREALALKHNYIGSGHILLGLLREGEGLAAKALTTEGIDADTLRRQIRAELS